MLVIGLFFQAGRSTLIGSFVDGERGVVLAAGPGCTGLLVQALQTAPLSDEVQVYTNYLDMVDVFKRPIQLALPEIRTERYSYKDKGGQTQWRNRKVPTGNQVQWDLLRALNRFYRWSIQYQEDLPACREWWELNYV